MTNKNIKLIESIGFWFWGLARISAILFSIYVFPRIPMPSNNWLSLGFVFGGVSAIIILIINAFYYFVKETDSGYIIELWKVDEDDIMTNSNVNVSKR